jgi:hypothetical protein
MLRQAMATKSATKRQVVSVAVLAFFTGTDDAVRRRATDDIAELAGLVRRMHALASPPPPPAYRTHAPGVDGQLLNDGDAKVRQTGKELYAALAAAWPDVAAGCVRTLSGTKACTGPCVCVSVARRSCS